MSESPSFRELSFISDEAKWVRPPFPDYESGCRSGREAAAEMVGMIQRSSNPVIFGTVARLLPTNDWTAFEIGFCAHLGIAIITGPETVAAAMLDTKLLANG